MEWKGKAFFNLLRMNAEENPAMELPLWQKEDLRGVDMDELFSRLASFGVILDKPRFSLYAESCRTPEELTECIAGEDHSPEEYSKLYLLLFELWRRLVKEQFCLSIFCDELDFLMKQYDRGELENQEPLQAAWGMLEDILDDTFDEGSSAEHLLAEVSLFCAHDIEQFLVDYIADQIEEGSTLYASELIEAFSPYATNFRRMDLLQTHAMALSDPERAQEFYERALEELEEEPSVELFLQFAEHVVHHGNLKLFIQVALAALPLIEKEQDFQQLLFLTQEYYRCADADKQMEIVSEILEGREDCEKGLSIRIDDEDFKKVQEVLERSL